MKKIFKSVVAFFCALGCVAACACAPQMPDEEVTVYMPDGAPALALAGLMAEDKEDDGVTYRVVSAELIASKVTNKDETKNADLCVMPLTAASKLLGSGERYTMLGTVTHGNLYMIAKEGAYTADNLSSLIGKKVGVLQINNVPGLTFKAVLNKYQIPWQEMTNEGTMSEDKVNLIAISGADAVGVLDADCFVVAEPAASAQAKKGYSIVGDLQALYGGENGYPQAVLVAKNELIESYSAWTKDFVEKVDAAAAWLQEADGAAIVSTVSAHMEDVGTQTSLKAPLLSSAVLNRCGIRFTYAATDKTEVNEFLNAMLAVNSNAAAIPSESFYWNYTK